MWTACSGVLCSSLTPSTAPQQQVWVSAQGQATLQQRPGLAPTSKAPRKGGKARHTQGLPEVSPAHSQAKPTCSPTHHESPAPQSQHLGSCWGSWILETPLASPEPILATPACSFQPCTRLAAAPSSGLNLAVALPGAPSPHLPACPDTRQHLLQGPPIPPIATGHLLGALAAWTPAQGSAPEHSRILGPLTRLLGPSSYGHSPSRPSRLFPRWGEKEPTALLASERPSAFLPSLKEHQKLNRAAHETLKGTEVEVTPPWL